MTKMNPCLVLIALSASTLAAAETKCPIPAPDAGTAFRLIERPSEGSLKEFLESHVVSRTATNEKCETMYHASIRVRNEAARLYLDSIAFGPRSTSEVNASNPRLGEFADNFYEYALAYGGLPAIADLTKRGGRIGKARAAQETNELMLVASRNSAEVLERFLQGVGAATINIRDKSGKTALRYATENPAASRIVVRLLQVAGIDPDLGDDYRTPPLLALIRNQSASPDLAATIEAILRKGADVNATDESGQSPFLEAFDRSLLEIMDLLVRAGANVNQIRKGRPPALYGAVGSGSLETTGFLLRSGADVNYVSDRTSLGILHLAIEEGTASKAMIETLVKAGAHTRTYWYKQYRPYEFAVQAKLPEEILVLLRCKD